MKEANHKIIYQSDTLTIDPQSGQVAVAADVIRLGPVNMRVLVALMKQQGTVISRTELFDSVWPNQIVSDDVLTRCISDLRSQLGRYSELTKLIETIPKRGYRWLPEVVITDSENPVIDNPVSNNRESLNRITQVVNVENNTEIIDKPVAQSVVKTKPNKIKIYFFWTLFSLIGLLVISTSSLWLVEKLIRTDLVRVALLPIQMSQAQHQPIASELEDVLTNKLLETKGLRFLARSAVANRPQNPFPYFAQEFGTRWIIEGQVRALSTNYRLTLSLVDAKTATIYYSLTQDIKNSPENLNHYCDLFVEQMTQQLDLTQ